MVGRYLEPIKHGKKPRFYPTPESVEGVEVLVLPPEWDKLSGTCRELLVELVLEAKTVIYARPLPLTTSKLESLKKHALVVIEEVPILHVRPSKKARFGLHVTATERAHQVVAEAKWGLRMRDIAHLLDWLRRQTKRAYHRSQTTVELPKTSETKEQTNGDN